MSHTGECGCPLLDDEHSKAGFHWRTGTQFWREYLMRKMYPGRSASEPAGSVQREAGGERVLTVGEVVERDAMKMQGQPVATGRCPRRIGETT